MPANTTFTSGAILTAAQMNNLPWGIVDASAGGTSGRGYVARTSGDISLTTTNADMTGLTVTFTAVTGRLYRIGFSSYVSNGSGGAQTILMQITTGGNTPIQSSIVEVNTSKQTPCTMFVIVSGLTGSNTYKLRGRAASFTGAVLVASAANEGTATFSVEDIGPST